MKPQDLKSPFQWEERRILVCDRIFYVPNQFDDYQSFTFPGWTDPQFFSKNLPICIEYCSGNGAWIAAKAQTHADMNWVAVERKFERVRKIWAKTKNLNLDNLMTICGEGFRVTQNFIPGSSVRAVYINFPDPWPKKKHAKHRIIQSAFIDEIYRILEQGGVLTLVTDDEPYSKIMLDVLSSHSGFVSELPYPHFITDYPGYGTSYFENLWRQKGKTIRYQLYRKQ